MHKDNESTVEFEKEARSLWNDQFQTRKSTGLFKTIKSIKNVDAKFNDAGSEGNVGEGKEEEFEPEQSHAKTVHHKPAEDQKKQAESYNNVGYSDASATKNDSFDVKARETIVSRNKSLLKGTYGDLDYEILNPSMISLLKMKLKPGGKCKAESGAMVGMSDTISIAGAIDGGIGRALARKLLSKEKFFFQIFECHGEEGEFFLAPATVGDIMAIEVDGEKKYDLQKDGFLAATSGVKIRTKVQNISKGIFSGEGFFILKLSGSGLVFCNAFGSIHQINVPEGRSYTIDNKHLVAWTSTMKYKINPAAGMISTFTTGEILICKFDGPGTIYIQSRDPKAFVGWVEKIAGQEAAKTKNRTT